MLEKKSKIITNLNKMLGSELAAINQYFLHAKLCRHWGYNKLADLQKKQSIGEMNHADQLIERILFLDGMPILHNSNKINVGKTVLEQFNFDLALEKNAVDLIKQTIAFCNEESDHGTRLLAEKILASEEEHMDWLETQIELHKNLGKELYLSQMV